MSPKAEKRAFNEIPLMVCFGSNVSCSERPLTGVLIVRCSRAASWRAILQHEVPLRARNGLSGPTIPMSTPRPYDLAPEKRIS